MRSLVARPRRIAGPMHLIFCLVDHFEPFGYRAPREEILRWFNYIWRDEFPKLFSSQRFADSDMVGPRHTFFIAPDQYDPYVCDVLAEHCRRGLGEVEIHLHHRNATAETTREELSRFRDLLRTRHALLGSDSEGRVRYGFVHGNWALCNSRPDGDWCGVNEEISVLVATGCYADFTFPSAPSPTQPRMVNVIYRAWDRPQGRGHDYGEVVATPEWRRKSGERKKKSNVTRADPSLILVQGPLALNWSRHLWGVFPTLDTAGLEAARPAAPQEIAAWAKRIDLWVRQHIHVRGRPEWVFVKAHLHGSVPALTDTVLRYCRFVLHPYLNLRYDDWQQWHLHYVTAREMYNMVRAAEDGHSGNPGQYRNYEIMPPPVANL